MRDLRCEPVWNDDDSRQDGDHDDASDNASSGHDATGPRRLAHDSVDTGELSHGAICADSTLDDRTDLDFAGLESYGNGASCHSTTDHQPTALDDGSGRRRGWGRVLGAWMSGVVSECHVSSVGQVPCLPLPPPGWIGRIGPESGPLALWALVGQDEDCKRGNWDGARHGAGEPSCPQSGVRVAHGGSARGGRAP
jgi:hypothetical protein